MSFFNKLGNTLSAAGKDGMTKAKELKDTTKLNMDIKEREGAIQRMYTELGKAYYENHKDDIELSYEQIKSINDAFDDIKHLKSEIDSIKGVKRCPTCGSLVSPEAKFCAKCGTKFDEVNIKTEPEYVSSSDTEAPSNKEE